MTLTISKRDDLIAFIAMLVAGLIAAAFGKRRTRWATVASGAREHLQTLSRIAQRLDIDPPSLMPSSMRSGVRSDWAGSHSAIRTIGCSPVSAGVTSDGRRCASVAVWDAHHHRHHGASYLGARVPHSPKRRPGHPQHHPTALARPLGGETTPDSTRSTGSPCPPRHRCWAGSGSRRRAPGSRVDRPRGEPSGGRCRSWAWFQRGSDSPRDVAGHGARSPHDPFLI